MEIRINTSKEGCIAERSLIQYLSILPSLVLLNGLESRCDDKCDKQRDLSFSLITANVTSLAVFSLLMSYWGSGKFSIRVALL